MEPQEFCDAAGNRIETLGVYVRSGTPAWCQLGEMNITYNSVQRRVGDYFNLICVCGHHCDTAIGVARLDESIGNIHAVAVDTGAFYPYTPTITYYDSNFEGNPVEVVHCQAR